MTENTSGTSLTPHGSTEDQLVNSVGFLMPGLECKIIQTDGSTCDRNEEGYFFYFSHFLLKFN